MLDSLRNAVDTVFAPHRVLARMPPNAALMLLAIGVLAWAGPNLRSALRGALLPGWLKVFLAYLFLTVIALLATMMFVMLCRDMVLRLYRHRRVLIDSVRILGELSDVMSALVQAVYAGGTHAERQNLGGLVLRCLVAASCALFRNSRGANRALLFVCTPQGGALVPFKDAHVGFTSEEIELINLPIENSVAGWVYANAKPYVAAPAGQDDLFAEIQGLSVPQSVLCVPVTRVGTGGEVGVAAVLSVDSTEADAFRDYNARQLQVIASRVSDVFAAMSQE